MSGDVLLLVLLLLLPIALWVLVCNHLTHRKRIELIYARPNSNEYWNYSREWEHVSYESHLFYLITFRDPKKLYGPLTQSLWFKPRWVE